MSSWFCRPILTCIPLRASYVGSEHLQTWVCSQSTLYQVARMIFLALADSKGTRHSIVPAILTKCRTRLFLLRGKLHYFCIIFPESLTSWSLFYMEDTVDWSILHNGRCQNAGPIKCGCLCLNLCTHCIKASEQKAA